MPVERAHAREQPGLAVTAYWSRVLRHRFGIVGLAVVCGLFAALVVNALEPLYEAQVTLLLDTQGTLGPTQNSSNGHWMSSCDSHTRMQTQVVLLKSRALAESISERLKLWDDPEFDPRQVKPRRARIQVDWTSWVPAVFPQAEPEPPPTEAQARAATIASIVRRLKAKAIPDSRVIQLSFTANEPALAARVANAFADGYLEMGLKTNLQPVSKAATRVTERLASLREKVETSERKLQAYRETHGLLDRNGAPDLTDKQIQVLSDRLGEARARHDDLQELHKQLQRASTLPHADLIAHPILARNVTFQSLKASALQADREVSELAKRYGPLHPEMIAARSDLDAVRATLAAEISNAIANVAHELHTARTQVDKLEGELRALQTTTQDTRRRESDLSSLEQELESDRRLYAMFLALFQETDLDVGGASTNARVVDAAQVPASPVELNRTRIIAIAVLLGLVAGFAIAMLSEYLDNTLKGPQDVEDYLQVPVLGTVPLFNRRRRRKKIPLDQMFTDQPKSQFAEAIRTLRTGVVLSNVDDSRRVVLVTSSIRGEGKTTVAINLSLALGQSAKVLLIDADMRRASAAVRFGLPTDTHGLSNLVAGTAEESACIHRVEGLNVDILPAGPVPPDPLELLSSRRLAQALDRLRERYDWIVIDSAAAQAVSDALMLSRACDAVVFVIRANETPLPLIQVTVKRLRQVGAPLIGAVLNDNGERARYGHYHSGQARDHC